MRIPCVSTDKTIEGINELLLTCIIVEVVPFEVMNEDMTCNILNALNLSTFVNALTHRKDFVRSVSDNLSSTCSVSSMICLVVIAFYPEFEIPLSLDHCIVNFLISVKRLHIVNVVLDIACTADQAQIYNINTSQHSKGHSCSQESFKADDSCDQPSNQQNVANYHWNVPGRRLLYGIISLCKVGVSNVEKHRAEPVGHSLVYLSKCPCVVWIWGHLRWRLIMRIRRKLLGLIVGILLHGGLSRHGLVLGMLCGVYIVELNICHLFLIVHKLFFISNFYSIKIDLFLSNI